MTRGIPLLAFLVLVLAAGAAARAEEVVSTLELDSLSFVSFDERENYQIPSGASIVVRFHESKSNIIGFTIEPSGVTIPPIPIGTEGKTLNYTLVSGATGTLQSGAGNLQMEFTAAVNATVRDPEGRPLGEELSYTMKFTTQEASATDVTGDRTVRVEGAPLVGGPNYVQLVGAATNKADAFPEPGVAVYAVLSGRFDSLPDAIQ